MMKGLGGTKAATSMMWRWAVLLLLPILAGACTTASPRLIDPASVRAHVSFLASDALLGRGSATRDEAIAAAYVAAQFESYGLKPAPGMRSFLQTAPVPPSDRTRAARVPVGATTSNAIGYLPGSDPGAGILLISAHLDHLGMRNGQVFPGANDDASGTTAVLELARALAAMRPHRRGILFVCYGAEELGAVGSHYFVTHSPVPLSAIVANIEIEMIGAQDPKLPKGTMMMTGFERSNLGAALKQQGALIAPDLYPGEKFFERSDNYELAKAGVVAHTISGWVMTPTYHRITDTVANLDIAFMTRTIQSLLAPIRWLANADFRPQWVPGGRPRP